METLKHTNTGSNYMARKVDGHPYFFVNPWLLYKPNHSLVAANDKKEVGARPLIFVAIITTLVCMFVFLYSISTIFNISGNTIMR